MKVYKTVLKYSERAEQQDTVTGAYRYIQAHKLFVGIKTNEVASKDRSLGQFRCASKRICS